LGKGHLGVIQGKVIQENVIWGKCVWELTLYQKYTMTNVEKNLCHDPCRKKPHQNNLVLAELHLQIVVIGGLLEELFDPVKDPGVDFIKPFRPKFMDETEFSQI
jgi:hypothetical protein